MATGKHAFGLCDRTGFRYPLKELVDQLVDGRPTGLRVGRDMVDEDHPQLRLDEVDANDDVSLPDARPDTGKVESRGLSAWNPVGGGVTELGSRTVGLDMVAVVGRVVPSGSDIVVDEGGGDEEGGGGGGPPLIGPPDELDPP